MQYLFPVYAMRYLFRHKTLTQLKGFIYYRKNSSQLCSFRAEITTQAFYLNTPKFLNPSIRQSLKTEFLSVNI